MSTGQLGRSREHPDFTIGLPDALVSRLEVGQPPKLISATRLKSLDVFRGITIAGMLLVNNPGSWDHTYAPLEHARWNGWTPTDLIFPFFLFIVGVATPFSLAKRSAGEAKPWLLLHILARGLALFVLGELCYSIPSITLDAA